MKIVIILAKSADPDEMTHYAAFHLGLHCFAKVPIEGFQYTKCLVCHVLQAGLKLQ